MLVSRIRSQCSRGNCREGIGFQQELALPDNWVVPAGSSRTDGGSNKLVEAFDATVIPSACSLSPLGAESHTQ